MPRLPWLLVVLAGCGAARPPQVLGPPVAAPPARVPVGHQVLVGLMCPAGARGRPLLVALAARQPQAWIGDAAGLAAALGGGRVTDLSVLGFDGQHAGRFAAIGPAELGIGAPTALGAYAGALPCADEATAGECNVVLRGCGIAVSDEAQVARGGACPLGKQLVIDLEGDGKLQAFALGDLAGLPDEATATPAQVRDTCPPRFAFAAGADLDVLGVADFDGDGRVEVVVSRREAGGGRRVAVYTATTAQRLERVGVVGLR